MELMQKYPNVFKESKKNQEKKGAQIKELIKRSEEMLDKETAQYDINL